MEETKAPKPETPPQPEQAIKPKAPKRKTLAELFNEPCTIAFSKANLHQAVDLTFTTLTTLTSGKTGLKDLKLSFHPGYGLIIFVRGDYFLVPSANVIVGRSE